MTESVQGLPSRLLLHLPAQAAQQPATEWPAVQQVHHPNLRQVHTPAAAGLEGQGHALLPGRPQHPHLHL